MIPLGQLLCELAPGLLVPLGMDVVPRVSPEVLARALGHQSGIVTVFTSRRPRRSRSPRARSPRSSAARSPSSRSSAPRSSTTRRTRRSMRRSSTTRSAGSRCGASPMRPTASCCRRGNSERWRARTSASSSASFVKPLVAGGELHVGAPIPLPDVDRWEQELHDASVEQVEVDDARHAVLSTLVCRPPAFVLEARRARARGRPAQRAVPRAPARRSVVGHRPPAPQDHRHRARDGQPAADAATARA